MDCETHNYPKISAKSALKLRKQGYWIMHIEWFSERLKGYQFGDLDEEYPECSHVVVCGDKHWRSGPEAIHALVLGDRDNYNEELENKFGGPFN